jgi:hypothetical protein
MKGQSTNPRDILIMRHSTEVSFLNAISQHDTGVIVDSLINELNENFLTNLGSADFEKAPSN